MKPKAPPRDPIDGILLVNKAEGLSSNGVLQRVKRLLHAKKAGHTGSLDPLATGMLPICLGEATKFSQYLLDADKAYDVVGYLGVTTNTGDAEGEVVHRAETVSVADEALQAVLARLTGPIKQVPPMYSALKHQGRPLYDYARQGITLERPARDVIIHALTCHAFDGQTMHLTVRCSKGTYIRSLVESIGEMLGVGAYVTKLHRTYTAGFETDPMYSLETLEDETLEARRAHLVPLERAIVQFPRLDITSDVATALKQGKKVGAVEGVDVLGEGIVRLYAPDDVFLGLGELTPERELIVKRLLATGCV